ncbi:MAG: hypothetical protein JRI23_08320 [Deltaproteobacteria bacterium]|jgi:hypothetical protein|nr:hypothetical protein [Deltaproteobacteria bacterium]MBW2531618.1 hypothetical protein [Deltaproteobacteria bacterium]
MSTIGRLGAAAAVSLAAAASTLGCAFEPGDPYGLVSATLDARYVELADRATPDGFEQLDSDFQVRLTSATLTVDAIELLDAGAGAQVSAFDPANPPPGYGSCHGGHCHADDGSLVDYETIAAELASAGGATLSPVIAMLTGALDMLALEPVALRCEPDCALPEGHLVLARMTASRLDLYGEVRDSRTPPRFAGVLEWGVGLSLLEPIHHADEETLPDEEHDHEEAAGVFELPLDLPIDEDHPPQVALAFTLPTDAALLDAVDFASVPPTPGGGIDLDGVDGEHARAELASHLAHIEARVSATRSED